MKYIIAFSILFVTMATAKVDYVLNYKRLDTRQVIITCSNGGDPTGIAAGRGRIIIDCGK